MSLISVTQALDPFTDFSSIPPHVLEHAIWRGIEVHKICAGIANGLFSPRPQHELAGRIQSFKGWFSTTVERVVFVEREYICTCYQYVGHPDLGVVIKGDNGITVVDLKTPITEGRTWRGQLAAYRHLVECCEAPVRRSGALMLNPDGKPAKLKEYQDGKEDFAAFLAALTATRYFGGKR